MATEVTRVPALPWLLVVALTSLLLSSATTSGLDTRVGRNCRPCDVRRCVPVSAYQCAQGRVVKDRCGCCPRCAPAPPEVASQPAPGNHPSSEQMKSDSALSDGHGARIDPCEGIICSGFLICIPNMQGLAVCRCPRQIYCRNRLLNSNKSRRSLRACGDDAIIYKSSCYLAAKACELSTRINQVKMSYCKSVKRKKKIAIKRKKRANRKKKKKKKREAMKKLRMKKKKAKRERKRKNKAARKQKLLTMKKLQNVAYEIDQSTLSKKQMNQRKRNQNKKERRKLNQRKKRQKRQRNFRRSRREYLSSMI